MLDQELKKFIKESLKEDIKDGDHTTLACIDKNNISTAKSSSLPKSIPKDKIHFDISGIFL